MIKTSIILILTFIVVPIATYYLDDPLTPEQSGILWNCIYICLGVASYCFIVSQLTGNCSQVDKLWSLIPIVYVWVVLDRRGRLPMGGTAPETGAQRQSQMVFL